MSTLKKILLISRPRFWIYTIGPFWLCAALLYPFSLGVPFLLMLLYFTFPANILIYGVNDLYDRETDALNAKKMVYEGVLDQSTDSILVRVILISNIPFIVYAIYALPANALLMLIFFIVIAWQYSARPLRAKAIPFVDSLISGLLYVIPAGVSWGIVTGSFPSIVPMSAGFVWAYAMHLYSAVPDISSDTRAHIKTGATVLGKNTTLVFCGVLYAVSAMLAYPFIGVLALYLGLVYLVLICVSIYKKTSEEVLSVYKIFPVVNMIVGVLLFSIFLTLK